MFFTDYKKTLNISLNGELSRKEQFYQVTTKIYIYI